MNNKLTVLSTLLRYAATIGVIPEPKLKCHVKSMSAEIVAVPTEDVARLLGAAKDTWLRMAVLLAAEAGLRVGEVRGLQWTDVQAGQLTVRRAIDQSDNVTTPKHDKRRSIPLSPALALALQRAPRRGIWVVAQDDGEAMAYERMLAALNALYVAAGVTVPKSETGVTMPWHSLRHTFGTQCAARGVEVPTIRVLMGHASISTTMRYVTVTGAQLDGAIARAFGQRVGNEGAAGAEKTKPSGDES